MKSQYVDLIKKIFEDAKSRVSIHCDEYHSHSALQGCLSGQEHDINICKLCEIIKILEYRLDKIKKIIEEGEK